MNDLPVLRRLADERAATPAVWVSGHALDRLREHYPDANGWSAGQLLLAAVEVPGDVVREMLQRAVAKPSDRYFLAADRRGLFVLAPSTRSGSPFLYTLVTYLRFSPWQAELAERLYPLPAAPEVAP